MDRQSCSEIVFGLALLGKLNSDLVQASWLSAPFNRALPALKDKPDKVELQAKFGLENIRAAEWAAEEIKSEDAAKWLDILQQAAVRDDVGRKLERIAKKLQSGENGSGGELLTLAEQLDKKTTDVMTMKEVVVPDQIWVPSFYVPIDENIGGYPSGGLTIIAGPAKLGKTSLLLKLLACTAKEGKKALFFSLEMRAGMTKHRLTTIVPGMKQADLERILVTDKPMTADDVYAVGVRAASEHDIHFIGIDYATKLLDGMASVETMSQVYAKMARLATVTDVPVVLLAGVSRGYVGGEVMANHIWFSGQAEHEASLILLIHNPGLLEVDQGIGAKHTLPYYPGQGYIKVGASRIGTKHGGMGAVRIAWDEKRGRWSDNFIEFHSKIIG